MSKSDTKVEAQSENVPTFQHRVPVLRILYFFYFAAFGIIGTYLNIYYRDSGLSGMQIGILASVMPLVSVVAAPLWGIWSDRIGQVKNLLTIAGLGIIVAVSGIWFVDLFPLLIVFTVLFAFFNSSVLTILDSTTLRALGKNRERFGRERVWGSIGFIFAVWGVGYILGILTSRWFFLFYILAILCMVVTLYWLPNQKTEFKPTIYSRISELLSRKEWIIFSASLLLIGLGSSSIEGFLGIYIKEMGGNEGLVGTAAALATLTELPIMIWGEKIIKRYGSWRLLMVAYGVSVFRLVFYSIIPEPRWVLLISLLHSLSFGVYWIATIAFVDQITSEEIKSSAQGMLYAVLYFSRMLSSLVCGYLFDRVGGRYLFLISALFSLMAVLLFWFNRPNSGQMDSVEDG